MYDPDEPRTCRKCGETKSADNFEPVASRIVNGETPVYLRRECRACRGQVDYKPRPQPLFRCLRLDPPAGIPIYNPGCLEWMW